MGNTKSAAIRENRSGASDGGGRPTALKPIRKARISDAVVVQLTDLILSGEYGPGDKFPPERELAGDLSITRTSLREALRQLERMGLVSVRQGDGIYVQDHTVNAGLDFVHFIISHGLRLDRAFILSLDEARRVFATAMVELAAERIDEESLARLEAVVEAFPRTATSEFLSGEWDFKFFHEIARASRNRVFVYMLNTIKDTFAVLRRIYTPLDESPAEVADLNARVVAALEAGDAVAAVALVDGRMKQDQEKLSEILEEMQ